MPSVLPRELGCSRLHPAEMADYAAQVFGLALGPDGGAPYLLAVAVIVIVLGVAARWSVRRWRR